MFNTDCGDMRVNNYLVWDPKTRVAAIFDTGASCEELLHFIRAEKLKVHYLFITHAHDDHVAALDTLVEATGAEVWTHPLEPLPRPGFRQFAEGAYFHIGELAIKTIRTSGHSPGMTTFYVTGLSWPLAIVGDSLFAGSMGGSATAFGQQYQNTSSKILTLPKETVLAPGHGPLTTVSQEKRHNPFFAPRNERASLEDVIQSKSSSNA
jgi:glyoxylase-like metal-dependent hydrolase (beta-lactamase superfamily II)